MPEQIGRRSIAIYIAIISSLLAGCQQTRSQYVEAELRYQSRQVRQLEEKIAARDAEIETLKSTLGAYQASYVKPSDAPESVFRETAAGRIALTMVTGGKDADLDGKDDGIVVGVAPIDFDGDTFKCPGTIFVDLYEIPETGVKQQIGHWTFDPESLRTRWQTSLMGQNYNLTMNWLQVPKEKKLRVVATFQTLDGRLFAAEKDFSISLDAKKPPRKPGATPENDLMEPVLPSPPPPVIEERPKPRVESSDASKPRRDRQLKHAIEEPVDSQGAEIIHLPEADDPTTQASFKKKPSLLAVSLIADAQPLPKRGTSKPAPKAAEPIAKRVETKPATVAKVTQPNPNVPGDVWPKSPRWSDMVKRSNFFAHHTSAQ